MRTHDFKELTAHEAEEMRERSKRIYALGQRVDAAHVLPREFEALPLRIWSLTRDRRFDLVEPAEHPGHASEVGVAVQMFAAEGTLPTAGTVSHMAAVALDDAEAFTFLGYVTILVEWPREPKEPSFEQIVASRMIRAADRPPRLATLINAALVLEYAALHGADMRAMARLLTMASVCWWWAGQPHNTERNLHVAAQLEPTWPLVGIMETVLRVRKRPDWI